jgi:hypothetical protein
MASLDAVANLLKLTVSTGYDQAATSIVLSSGGSSLPAVSFNASWWNATDYPDPSDDPNAEIVRITAVAGNTLTITRAAESATGGGAASTKNTAGKTYKLMLGITAKMITDIGANLQKPWRLVNVSGTIDGSNKTFTVSIAPFDPNSIDLKLDRQPQEQGTDYTFSGTTITYIVAPDASLAGTPHTAKYQ